MPREWRLARGAIRAALGLSCLLAQLFSTDLARLFSPKPQVSAITISAAVFTAYALAALLWRKLDRLQMFLITLFLETAFFVGFSVYGADRNGWLSSVFYLYLMTVAVVNHSWGDVLIVVGACLGFFGFVRPPEGEPLRRAVLIAGLLACALGFQKRRLQQRITESARRENLLRAEADKTRDTERQRIAADFHDGPLQSFIGLQVRLDILGTLLKRDRPAGMEDLKEVQGLAKEQVSEIRSFLRSMLPAEADSGDLVASTRRTLEYFQKDTGISTRFISTESAIHVAPEMSHEVALILREALTNVQKHSRASRVAISMEQTGKTVEISIDDDGAGFAFSGSFTLDELDLLRVGPQSIKRRVRGLGGDLVIESRPGHGAGLKIRIPA